MMDHIVWPICNGLWTMDNDEVLLHQSNEVSHIKISVVIWSIVWTPYRMDDKASPTKNRKNLLSKKLIALWIFSVGWSRTECPFAPDNDHRHVWKAGIYSENNLFRLLILSWGLKNHFRSSLLFLFHNFFSILF